MGLFNNLRQHIVRKLIRPEDGYIYVGTYEKEPVQLVHELFTGKYYFSRVRNGQRVYYKPTLTGWSQVEDELTTVDTDFSEWIIGVLNNIYDQYSEKLSNISRKELKQFQKSENKDWFMINKQSFCDIMEALDKYWHNLDALENILNVVFERNVLTEIFDAVIDALEEDLEPDREFNEDPMIMRWLFEFDAGRDETAKDGIDGHPLTTAEELYDYLVWKRGGEQHED